ALARCCLYGAPRLNAGAKQLRMVFSDVPKMSLAVNRRVLLAISFLLCCAGVQAVESDAHTLLLLHFENSLNGVAGETPTQVSGVTFETGVNGVGAYFA